MGSNDLDGIAYRLGKKPDLVEKLDTLLECPKDRAFILCSFVDCTHNTDGHCDIYLVLDPGSRTEGKPCHAYAPSV